MINKPPSNIWNPYITVRPSFTLYNQFEWFKIVHYSWKAYSLGSDEISKHRVITCRKAMEEKAVDIKELMDRVIVISKFLNTGRAK